MKKNSLLLLIAFVFSLNAKIIIPPVNAMKQAYPSSSKIDKKNITLTNTQAKKIQKKAKAKLKNKKIKVFKAMKKNKVLGYGILINKKVRSKNAAILYIISSDSILKSIEIIAFNEPLEYIPSKTWMKKFENSKTSKNIPNITGATLSAKSIIDGSRLAFSFYEEMLKGKK